MCIWMRWSVRLAAIAILGAGAAPASSAQGLPLPRLPGELKLARSADSPGQVVFYHSTHVDESKPDCTVCHPREFRILKANAVRRPMTHAAFEKSGQCGACHNGKKAFAIEQDCTNCHRG